MWNGMGQMEVGGTRAPMPLPRNLRLTTIVLTDTHAEECGDAESGDGTGLNGIGCEGSAV